MIGVVSPDRILVSMSLFVNYNRNRFILPAFQSFKNDLIKARFHIGVSQGFERRATVDDFLAVKYDGCVRVVLEKLTLIASSSG